MSNIVGDQGKLVYHDSVDEIPSHPIVLSNDNGEFWVRLDNEAFAKTTSLKDAMMATVFCFNIFRVEVPVDLIGTIQFINP